MITNREFKNQIYEQFTKIGKALCSPIRLELIDLLSQGEHSVETLAKGISQSTANTSQHLQVLLANKIVSKKRKGNHIIYRLSSNKVYSLWKSIQEIGEDCFPEIKLMSDDFFEASEELKEMTDIDLLQQANKQEIIIIDVRLQEEFEYRHIKGAVSLPLDQIKEHILSLDKNKTIIAYCRGRYCVLSHEAVKTLKDNGFTAYRLTDSVLDWQDKKLPIESKNIMVNREIK